MSIVAAIVAFVLVGIAAVGLGRAFSLFSLGKARLDHSERGDQVLVRTAARIQELDFDDLVELCKARRAIPGPVDGRCASGNALNPALVFDPATVNDGTLEVPRDWEGAPIKGGQVCIELNQCTRRGGGLLLQLRLRGFWHDPKMGLQSRMLTLRRTRW